MMQPGERWEREIEDREVEEGERIEDAMPLVMIGEGATDQRMWQPLKAGKSKKADSPQEPPEETALPTPRLQAAWPPALRDNFVPF